MIGVSNRLKSVIPCSYCLCFRLCSWWYNLATERLCFSIHGIHSTKRQMYREWSNYPTDNVNMLHCASFSLFRLPYNLKIAFIFLFFLVHTHTYTHIHNSHTGCKKLPHNSVTEWTQVYYSYKITDIKYDVKLQFYKNKKIILQQ